LNNSYLGVLSNAGFNLGEYLSNSCTERRENTPKIKDKVTEKVRLLHGVDNLPTDLKTIFDISFEGSSGVPSVEWFNYL